MIVFGGVAAAAGALLFLLALRMTLRANPGTRIPFARNAEVIPAGSVVLRATGAGLLVLGSVLLSTAVRYWSFVLLLAVLVVALSAIVIHNRGIRAGSGATVDAAHEAPAEQGVAIVPPRPWLASFDGANWVPTSWGALLVVAALAVVAGVLVSWLS